MDTLFGLPWSTFLSQMHKCNKLTNKINVKHICHTKKIKNHGIVYVFASI